MPHPQKILFLCTGNSARSILGEYLLRSMDPRFEVFSAGAEPTGKVHPMAQRVLKVDYGIDASDASSKSWDAIPSDLDLVITVCDHARDTCPVLPNSSALKAHWGSPDPAAVRGSEQEIETAFRHVARQIHRRLERFCTLPFADLEDDELAEQIRRMGTEASGEA